MKSFFSLSSALILLAWNLPAEAQVVYEPVRYQYGQYGEVFYGGRNPAMTNQNFAYLPPSLQAAYTAQRLAAPPWAAPYMPYGPGTAFFSPYTQDSTTVQGQTGPLIFSDYLPNEEAGQFGFTINDARNEAYANVARIQTGARAPAARQTAAAPTEASPVVAPATDPRPKAIPLLNWAKAERTKNPELYNALLTEARKYDPSAVDAFVNSSSK